MKILGERLKQLREENGFTQGKLAELLGLPQSSIARYESEVSSPAPETLLPIPETTADFGQWKLPAVAHDVFDSRFRDSHFFCCPKARG